jgi:hypothetical protein
MHQTSRSRACKDERSSTTAIFERSQGEILLQNYGSIRSVDESAREIHSTTRAVSRIADSLQLGLS